MNIFFPQFHELIHNVIQMFIQAGRLTLKCIEIG